MQSTISTNIKLRPYQAKCVSKILWSLNLDGNSIISMAQGSGKTHVIADFVKQYGKPVLILVPSKELLEQDLEKLSHVVDPKDIGIFSASMDSKEVKHITIGTIQSVYKKPDLFQHYKVVLVDECFVAGTKVDDRNIEDIKIGDFVDSFNHETGIIEKKKVLATSKRLLKQDLYLTSLRDSSIISTGNHPVYVLRKGYVPVDKLQKRRDFVYAKQEKSNRENALLRMWYVSNSEKLPSILEIQEVWKDLPQKMFFYSKGRYYFIYKTQSKNYFLRGIPQKNVGEIKSNRTQAIYTGWEWETNSKTATDIIDLPWNSLEERIYIQNKQELASRISTPLQDRHSSSTKEDSDRDRWWFSRFLQEATARPKKGSIIDRRRVESVEIYKPRNKQTNGKDSDTPTFVYNLQVEDNNNYFANKILVHNCDLINPKNFEGMYNKLFQDMQVKVIGLTATPFRRAINYQRWGQQKWMVKSLTTTKMINRVRPVFWDRMLEVVNVRDLQEQGYLTTLTYKDVSLVQHEAIPTNKSQSEFDLEKFEAIVCNDYTSTAEFISNLPHKKKLVFCSSVKQAETLQALIKSSEVVSAITSKKVRENAIRDFREGAYETLLGCDIFTVGFDVPDIDCIVVLRPTKSLRLWTQVLGRGTRLSPGKHTCTVYDFVGNVKALGTLESMEIKKINNKWNVVTDAKPNGFHGVNLFEYKLKDPSKRRFYGRRELLT